MSGSARASIPRTVVALGVVSLLMDSSSELIHSLLPSFLVTVLGASALAVGVLEGIAESVVSISKIFSGALSDWLGKRKLLVLAGYGLAALTKPLFPLASNVGMVFAARVIDRVGKGIRGAPRDALIADVTPQEVRGAAFGLRQAMDTVGAFVGPGLAIALMVAAQGNFRIVLWAAVVPAFLAVVTIVVAVREPETIRPAQRFRLALRGQALRRFSAAFWWLVAIATVLTLARFSEAFLLLAAQRSGIPPTFVPVVLVTMNVVYAAAAYPFGRISDTRGRGLPLMIGAGFLIVADLTLAWSTTPAGVLAGTVLWGLHMGATQGLLSAMVVDGAPADLRGTAFGIFNLVTGGGALSASVLAGWLWTAAGPQATFAAGAVIASAGLLSMAVYRKTNSLASAGTP